MSVSEMNQLPAGTVVKIGQDYLDYLDQEIGNGAWLPKPDDLAVTLFSYGNVTVVALLDAGPGFTIMHNGNVMGALCVPTNELTTTADNIHPVEPKLRQRTYVFSGFAKWGGSTAAVATMYLMGVRPGEVARRTGVSRQYVHISAERITSELIRRGYRRAQHD